MNFSSYLCHTKQQERRNNMKKKINLHKVNIEDLKKVYFHEYSYDSRLPELFDLIGERKLKKYLINRFENDFTNEELEFLF